MPFINEEVALLVPFPARRIIRAWEISGTEMMVAFGSNSNWDFWRELEKLRKESHSVLIQTLIYLSNQGVVDAKPGSAVTWTALFERWTPGASGVVRGPHRNGGRNHTGLTPEEWQHDDEHFAGWLELTLLRELNRPFPIGTLRSFQSGRLLSEQSCIRGPMLVRCYDITQDFPGFPITSS